MAEVGTIIAVIQLADRVGGLCKWWIEAVRDAPRDLRSILLETSTLHALLKSIEFLTTCDDDLSPILRELSKKDGPLEQCHMILGELGIILSNENVAASQGKLSAMLARLAWPLKETKARKLLQELGRYKGVITLAMTTESAHDIKEIKSMLSDSQRREVCNWLQQTDPSPLHHRAKKLVEEGTCEWILRTPEWKEWIGTEIRCLWIHGIPGAGKTVLASHIIDTIPSQVAANSELQCTVLYYYCYFGHNQGEAAPFLRWLVTQLSRQANSVSGLLWDLFKQHNQPTLTQLLEALARSLNKAPRVFVVIDAVDESNPRSDLLKVLRDLASDQRFSKIQLCVTSREYMDIENVMQDISAELSMSNPFVDNDIRRFVSAELRTNQKFRRKFKRWPSDLLAEAEEALGARSRGMFVYIDSFELGSLTDIRFRWAVCQIDRLQRLKPDPAVVRTTLRTLPKTLDETYERIFSEIPQHDKVLVRQCLKWIEFHYELHGDGIPCDILAQVLQTPVETDDDACDQRYVDEEELREICGCLIQISDGIGFKIEIDPQVRDTTQIVSFSHYTVREFLSSDRTSKTIASYFMLPKNGIQLDVLECVLRLAQQVNGLTLSDDNKSPTLGDEGQSETESDELELYKKLSTDRVVYCVVAALFATAIHSDKFADRPELRGMTLKLLDPRAGQLQNVLGLAHFIQAGCNLFIVCMKFRTAFDFWSLNFHEDPSSESLPALQLLALTSLIGTGAFVADFAATNGTMQKLVHQTITFSMDLFRMDTLEKEVGHELRCSILDLNLLAEESNPNEWLRFVLGQGVHLESPTADLLSYTASLSGSFPSSLEEVRKVLTTLMEEGASLNAPDYTMTPLAIAATRGWYDMAKALIDAGADPNAVGKHDGVDFVGLFDEYKGMSGWSPLYACLNSQITIDGGDRSGVRELLIHHGAQSFTVLSDGEKLLSEYPSGVSSEVSSETSSEDQSEILFEEEGGADNGL